MWNREQRWYAISMFKHRWVLCIVDFWYLLRMLGLAGFHSPFSASLERDLIAGRFWNFRRTIHWDPYELTLRWLCWPFSLSKAGMQDPVEQDVPTARGHLLGRFFLPFSVQACWICMNICDGNFLMLLVEFHHGSMGLKTTRWFDGESPVCSTSCTKKSSKIAGMDRHGSNVEYQYQWTYTIRCCNETLMGFSSSQQ